MQSLLDGDGCRHVLLDLGTNTAVQVHKLYQPALFQEQPIILPVYDRFFGPGNHSDVCTFGWEPNPRHATYLAAVESYYRARGIRVVINVAAAGTADGWGTFQSDGDTNNREWASSVAMGRPESTPPAGAVRVMDVAGWVARHILPRRIPAAAASSAAAAFPPAIVMKLDIEGMDENVLAELFRVGVLCAVDYVYVERHVRESTADFLNTALRDKGCKSPITLLDDEAYLNFLLPGLDTGNLSRVG